MNIKPADGIKDPDIMTQDEADELLGCKTHLEDTGMSDMLSDFLEEQRELTGLGCEEQKTFKRDPTFCKSIVFCEFYIEGEQPSACNDCKYLQFIFWMNKKRSSRLSDEEVSSLLPGSD